VSGHGRGVLLAGLILLGNAAYVIAALGPLHRSKTVLETDQRVYMEMAWGPPGSAEVAAPYCWRLLTPSLVFLLMKTGLGMNAAYYLLTNLALFAFLFCLHAYLGRLGFTDREAALGLLLCGLLPAAIRWYEYQYWMTDPLGLLFVTLGFLLVLEERHAWLAALGTLAIANRETFVLVSVYFLVNRLRKEPPRAAIRRALVVALPMVLVLLGIRLVLLPRPDESLVATLVEMSSFRLRHLFDNQLYFGTLGSFGVLLPLSLMAPRLLLDDLRRHFDAAVYLALVYASLLLANNTDRLLVYAVPVLVPLALRGLRSLARGGVTPSWAAPLALALQALFYQQTLFHGHQGISIYQPTNWLVILSMVGFWLVAQWWRHKARPSSG
jgi:uncharacterized protein YjeT (DUF2065 family)